MPGKGKPFVKGHKLAKGGARPGAGRKPNWYRDYCEEILRDRKLLPRLGDIAEGKEIFSKRDMFGKPYPTSASPETQVMATDKLMDRAWGKAPQAVQHTGEVAIDIFELIRRAEKERGLPSSFDD